MIRVYLCTKSRANRTAQGESTKAKPAAPHATPLTKVVGWSVEFTMVKPQPGTLAGLLETVCGACISITGPFGTHKGIVSDQCASCKADSLDLGPELWKQVSNGQNPGVLPINWFIVPCNFSTPIKFINKDGVSKDWNSVQVAGAEVPIRSLEVMPITNPGSEDIESKSWIRLTKQSNSNHFQPESGKGLGKLADLRVTCDNGKQIITKNVKLDRPTNTTDAVGNC
ncbi:hypothetical protein PSTG_05289 [Puccinia striiformis f. sp. tritici PST-78]|uniref:Uncharacterized protein n=1 Tax=Puccinia striiformis f. sp. tritici PST-78 TaxID=1165861 RepID=A0A0L0VQG7_9BASI|nr:hypothetical protein PSTG_05289 [Puccinia striiformis f. sp. tritici PST-78]